MRHLHGDKPQQPVPDLHSRGQALVGPPRSAPRHVGVGIRKQALEQEEAADAHMVGVCLHSVV